MGKKLGFYAQMIFVGFLFIQCRHKELPVLTTSDIYAISNTSAMAGGDLVNDGGEVILSKGICWKNALERWRIPQEPTIDDHKVVSGEEPDHFALKMLNLDPGTTYYIRAFAINKNGVGYGPEKIFKTLEDLPVITIKAASDITAHTVHFEGTVNPGNVPTEVYFEYGITQSYGKKEVVLPNPLSGDLPLRVQMNATGLLPNTTYHFRLVAENATGSVQSDDVTFTTSELVSDIDGNSYEVVTIGNSKWLKQNLRTTRYRDGSVIQMIPNDSLWNLAVSGALSSYNRTNSNMILLGGLYNWYAVEDPRGLCPEGWHVPTNEEFIALETFLGGPEVAGGKLKATGLSHWAESGIMPNNSTNFTAQGGGFRDQSGIFAGLSDIAYFWTSTEYSKTHGIARKLYFDNPMISFSGNSKKSGFSVRCIKD